MFLDRKRPKSGQIAARGSVTASSIPSSYAKPFVIFKVATLWLLLFSLCLYATSDNQNPIDAHIEKLLNIKVTLPIYEDEENDPAVAILRSSIEGPWNTLYGLAQEPLRIGTYKFSTPKYLEHLRDIKQSIIKMDDLLALADEVSIWVKNHLNELEIQAAILSLKGEGFIGKELDTFKAWNANRRNLIEKQVELNKLLFKNLRNLLTFFSEKRGSYFMQVGNVIFLNDETNSQFTRLQDQITAVQKKLSTAQLTGLDFDFDFMVPDIYLEPNNTYLPPIN